MVRKTILVLLAVLVLLSWFGLAAAQQPSKLHRIGLLISASDVIAPFTDAFRQGLAELGYVEKKNYVLEIRGGSAATDRLFDLAAELVGMNVDVIVTVGSPALKAAAKSTRTTPIVMRIGGDPVKAGHVATLARPAGNITGLFARSIELSGKRLELLAEIVPGINRIAVLTAQSNFEATNEYKDIEGAARALGVKLQILWARNPNAIDSAFSAMSKDRAQALVQIPHALYSQHAALILKHAAKSLLPTIYSHRIDVENGGLLSYGVNYTAEYGRTAFYVDRILKGMSPGDLPVEQPTKFELVINLKTAKQIRLTIPPHVLARADRVIR
jgi:putative ABC transport system substrate-binding protein